MPLMQLMLLMRLPYWMNISTGIASAACRVNNPIITSPGARATRLFSNAAKAAFGVCAARAAASFSDHLREVTMHPVINRGPAATIHLRQSSWRAPWWEENSLDENLPDDITGQEVKGLLQDLMELAGQPAASRPALELEIRDILTCTSVEPEGEDLYLCVTGLLPACRTDLPTAALLGLLGDGVHRAGFELLWDADRGRYIVVRKLPLRELSDERSVMDEILNTADIAQRCLQELARR